MSKTKNKSQKGKPLRLNDAVLQYHAKNYSGALSRLKSAEIRPDEAPKAKKLEYLLTLKLGFQELRGHEYAKTISILQSLSSSDALARFRNPHSTFRNRKMLVKIICPLCRANNDMSEQTVACRRCREDLSLLYAVKAYSYKARLHALRELAEKEFSAARYWVRTAQRLDKSV